MARKTNNSLAKQSAAAAGSGARAGSATSRRLREYRRRHARRVVFGIGLCFIIAAVVHTAQGFFQDVPYFKLAHLKIEGLANEQLQMELKGLVESAVEANNSILSLDAAELARVIGSHPRIRDLRLEKLYPDTLLIKAAERQPAAVLTAESFFLIDWDSHVIEQIKPANLRKFDFPYVSGISRDEIQVGEKIYNPNLYKALDLIRAAKEQNKEFYARLSEVHVGSDPISHLDSITAHMKGGMEVRFGDKNPIEQLPSFDVYVDLMKKQKNDPYKMHYVDLRFKDQVVYMDEATALAAAAGMLDEYRKEQEQELEKAVKTALPQKAAAKNRENEREPTKVRRASVDERDEAAPAQSRGSGALSRPVVPETSRRPDSLGNLPQPSAVR